MQKRSTKLIITVIQKRSTKLIIIVIQKQSTKLRITVIKISLPLLLLISELFFFRLCINAFETIVLNALHITHLTTNLLHISVFNDHCPSHIKNQSLDLQVKSIDWFLYERDIGR